MVVPLESPQTDSDHVRCDILSPGNVRGGNYTGRFCVDQNVVKIKLSKIVNLALPDKQRVSGVTMVGVTRGGN